jgi:ring-1,2-phenylacetyl-CoA epoxidase subunit PaaD
MVNTMSVDTQTIWQWLEDVKDPEIPALSIVDLGIVRDVALSNGNQTCVVTITPTYSGCPAMIAIADGIADVLKANGLDDVTMQTQLSPAWTTDWMSDAGKKKLKEYGIAPPVQQSVDYQTIDISRLLSRNSEPVVPCPKCGSVHTQTTSRFGSTSCKALYICQDCHEPFDYFKSH